MKYPMPWLALCAAFLVALAGCDLLDPPGTDTHIDFQQENGDCVMLTISAANLPEDVEAVTVVFGDGTFYEGTDFPSHEYCHQGVYDVSVTTQVENDYVTYSHTLFVYDVALPDLDVFLDVGNVGTELHAVNIVRVTSPNNFDRNYGVYGSAFVVHHDEGGNRTTLQGAVEVEIETIDENSPLLRQALTEESTGFYRTSLDNNRHRKHPKWFVDDELLIDASGENFIALSDNADYETSLPLRVEPVPMDEPLTLSMRRNVGGGVSSFRYLVRRGDDVRVYDPAENESSVQLSTDVLADFGPGPLEIWGIAQGRFEVADSDPLLILANTVAEGKTIYLAE